jgi:hypothetical protein
LVLEGVVPTISMSGSTSITPESGSLALAGVAPSTIHNYLITPPAGALTFTDILPSLLVDYRVEPAVGSLIFNGLISTLDLTDHQTITPPTGSLNFTSGVSTVSVTGAATARRWTFNPFTGNLDVY